MAEDETSWRTVVTIRTCFLGSAALVALVCLALSEVANASAWLKPRPGIESRPADTGEAKPAPDDKQDSKGAMTSGGSSGKGPATEGVQAGVPDWYLYLLAAVTVVGVLLLAFIYLGLRKTSETANSLRETNKRIDGVIDALRQLSASAQRGSGEGTSDLTSTLSSFREGIGRIGELSKGHGETLARLDDTVVKVDAKLESLPRRIADALDVARVAREVRLKEEEKKEYVASVRQMLTDMRAEEPSIVSIAEKVADLARGAKMPNEGVQEIVNRYISLAKDTGDLSQSLLELEQASGHGVPALRKSVAAWVQEFQKRAADVARKHKPFLFCEFLDSVDKVSGTSQARASLMQLLGIREVRPRKGAVIEDREEYEITRDSGQGRELEVDLLEAPGYLDFRNNLTLRKPKVSVMRRQER
jgi:CHASE3 domain sensor protein